jgi:hypothetical protein
MVGFRFFQITINNKGNSMANYRNQPRDEKTCANKILSWSREFDKTLDPTLFKRAQDLFETKKDYYKYCPIYNAWIEMAGKRQDYLGCAKKAFEEAVNKGRFNACTYTVWIKILKNIPGYDNKKLISDVKEFAETAIKGDFFDIQLCTVVIETLCQRSLADEDYDLSKYYFERYQEEKDSRLYGAMMKYAKKKFDCSFIIQKHEEVDQEAMPNPAVSEIYNWAIRYCPSALLAHWDSAYKDDFIDEEKINPFSILAMYTSGYLNRIQNSNKPWNMWKTKELYDREASASKQEHIHDPLNLECPAKCLSF